MSTLAQAEARQPLQGWFGHAQPFSFQPGYAPAEGIRHFLCGTPSVLACSALEVSCLLLPVGCCLQSARKGACLQEALDLMLGVDLHAVRRKSVAMGRLFWALVQQARSHNIGSQTFCKLSNNAVSLSRSAGAKVSRWAPRPTRHTVAARFASYIRTPMPSCRRLYMSTA